MKPCQNPTQIGFTRNSLHTANEPPASFYLKQRASFFIAAISLFAFLIGNMVGQHGWYTFFASVLGQTDYTQIVYQGTVPPLHTVVDYECWGTFGGNPKEHTFRQAPRDCQVPLPLYRSDTHLLSMEYMSSYAEGSEGSGDHSGVDIRVPIQTPVQSVMNAVVEKVGSQPRGFGTYIVLRHPNVPDPHAPNTVTTLYSTYGHLSTVYVSEGDILSKGDLIGLSGNTGFSTGPHLDFRLVRDDAPFLPYDPSTMADGYRYTVSPLEYVEANYTVDNTIIVAKVAEKEVATEQSSILSRLIARRAARTEQRLAARERRITVSTEEKPVQVLSHTEVETARSGIVSTVSISHDRSFSGRGWEKVRVRLLDDEGNTVTQPHMSHDILLRTEFGTAEFRPQVLSALDFEEGEATVYMLPRGRRTVVIKVLPYNVIAEPMEYER